MLLAAFPGRFIFCDEQRVRGGRGEQPPSPALPSPSASRGREKCLAGYDLDEDAPFAASRESKVASSALDGSFSFCFYIQISLAGRRGWTLTHQATGESVTLCSSAGGKHWEYKLGPESFPGVISL